MCIRDSNLATAIYAVLPDTGPQAPALSEVERNGNNIRYGAIRNLMLDNLVVTGRDDSFSIQRWNGTQFVSMFAEPNDLFMLYEGAGNLTVAGNATVIPVTQNALSISYNSSGYMQMNTSATDTSNVTAGVAVFVPRDVPIAQYALSLIHI